MPSEQSKSWRMDASPVNVAKAPSSHVLNKNLSPLSLKKYGVGGGCGSTKTSTTDLSIAAVQQQHQQDQVAVQNNNYSNLDMESLDDMLRKVIFNLIFFCVSTVYCVGLSGVHKLSQLVLVTLGNVPTSSFRWWCSTHPRQYSVLSGYMHICESVWCMSGNLLIDFHFLAYVMYRR